MVVESQSSSASKPVMAGCDNGFTGAPCRDVAIKIGLITVRMEQFDAIFLNVFLNLPHGTPVCPALAMHHPHAQSATPRALIEFNVGCMNVIKEQQAIL